MSKLDQIEKNQKTEEEKIKLQQEYQDQKSKLDKALAMEIIDQKEYNDRLEKYKSKLDQLEKMMKLGI